MVEQKNPEITVIVPVYNAEKYLRQCLDSILSQKFVDFELVLVDDGSMDGSGKICDEYAAEDGRIRVFHRKNGGASSARNTGLDNATGKWIAFVDSDDYVNADYLSDLHSYVGQSDTDLVISSLEIFRDDGKSSPYNFDSLPKGTVSYDKSGYPEFITEQHIPYRGYSVSKLFRADIIEKSHLRFPEEISFCEDFCFLFGYLDSMDGRVVCSSDSDYYYREREGSLVHVGVGDFDKGLHLYRKIKGLIIPFTEKYGCRIEAFDLASFLHRAIMQATSVRQLKMITSEDWDFFMAHFHVISRKTQADKWMVSHFRSVPGVLLLYVMICRQLRNSLMNANMWKVLDTLKK